MQKTLDRCYVLCSHHLEQRGKFDIVSIAAFCNSIAFCNSVVFNSVAQQKVRDSELDMYNWYLTKAPTLHRLLVALGHRDYRLDERQLLRGEYWQAAERNERAIILSRSVL